MSVRGAAHGDPRRPARPLRRCPARAPRRRLDEHLEVIASHYVAALPVGWAPQALELARRAARRAAGLGARDECVRLLFLAREALTEIDDGGAIWCELTLELAEAQDRAGQTLKARATFMHVAARAEAVGLSSDFARAAVGYGGRLIWARPTGDPREIPMLERAYAALGADEPALRALLLARKSILRRDLAGADAILAGCRQAAELARAADDATTRAQVLGALVSRSDASGPRGSAFVRSTSWRRTRRRAGTSSRRSRPVYTAPPACSKTGTPTAPTTSWRRATARAIPAAARAALAARVFARGGRLSSGAGSRRRRAAARRPFASVEALGRQEAAAIYLASNLSRAARAGPARGGGGPGDAGARRPADVRDRQVPARPPRRRARAAGRGAGVSRPPPRERLRGAARVQHAPDGARPARRDRGADRPRGRGRRPRVVAGAGHATLSLHSRHRGPRPDAPVPGPAGRRRRGVGRRRHASCARPPTKAVARAPTAGRCAASWSWRTRS